MFAHTPPDRDTLQLMNTEYLQALGHVFYSGREAAPRGMKVLEVDNYVFVVSSPFRCLSTLKPLHTRLEYAEAELSWYAKGSNKPKDLRHPITGKSFENIWSQYSDDNVTVNSAYGQYIFAQYFEACNGKMVLDPIPMTQREWIRQELRRDPDSRRAVININQVKHKSLLTTKDFPCCVVMQFTIRNNRLNLAVVFRSQDIDTGLRNDVYTMCGLQRMMAAELKLECGWFSNVALNLHLYEKKWDDVRVLLEQSTTDVDEK